MVGRIPAGKVKLEWTSNFAYAIGLIATDGCLSNNYRHISFVSNEIEQIKNYLECLGIDDIKIGKTYSGSKKTRALRVQFGDVIFYNFLLSIGLTPAKSKTMGVLKIPSEYFFDFLRGCFDGDGSSYSYHDPRWRSSFMFYTSFCSASKVFIDWLRKEIEYRLGIKGHVTKDGNGSTYQLKYAKNDSLKLVKIIYYRKKLMCLGRKRLKIQKTLAIIAKSRKMTLTN